MNFNTDFIILNISYLLTVIALLVRDILILRSIIIAGELGFVIYGAHSNHIIMYWNMLFMTINFVQVVRLIRERRPVPIPEDLQDIYKNIFSELTTREFIYFWNMGKNITIEDKYLCRRNEIQKELLLILEGEVSILKDDVQVAKLTRGCFVAEMSFLTGEPASADVKCVGHVKCISWSQLKIHNLNHINSGLLMKIQLILGKDLSKKVKKQNC